MMEKVNKAIEDTQKAQLRLYDQWAVKQVHDFYQSYKSELGTGTDENRVYQAILSYFVCNTYLSAWIGVEANACGVEANACGVEANACDCSPNV
jgi:hypothetical protein